MITLITAAALAAQTAPAAIPHAQHQPMQHGQMTQHHEQHKDMKDCCKDCCKDMAKKHEGHGERGGHGAE